MSPVIGIYYQRYQHEKHGRFAACDVKLSQPVGLIESAPVQQHRRVADNDRRGGRLDWFPDRFFCRYHTGVGPTTGPWFVA